jgi:hypothetical protein
MGLRKGMVAAGNFRLIPAGKWSIKETEVFSSGKGRENLRVSRPLIRFLTACAALFASALLSPAADIPCVWTGVEKIVAVGDLHGDYDNFVLILKGTGMVADDLHWSGGATHLVQTGDILDRGTSAKDILDLLMRLEKEAAEAGGMVHVLLGNHEEMNIDGIVLDYPDYVTVEQFVSFLPEDFRKAREKDYLSGLPAAERAAAETKGLDLAWDNGLRLFWTTLEKDDKAKHAYINGFNETYGKWLLQKNAVIKINDIVFAHAGISREFSTWKLRDINASLREELEFFRGRMRSPQSVSRPFRPKIVYNSEGPLWYRGLAFKDEASSQNEINHILANLGARAIVVGHTFNRSGGNSPIVPHNIEGVSRYHNRVFIIDTGISHVYGGTPSALLINDGHFRLWEPPEETDVKGPDTSPTVAGPLSGEDHDKFLRQAAVAKVQKGTVSGRTDPWKITLEDGGITRKALFKYIDRRRPELIPESYKYELAAYELCKYLGLNFVPPVVEREIDGQPGSLQMFVENSLKEGERKMRKLRPDDPKAFDQDMADLRVFENIVYDSCTNDEDTLVSKDDWKIYRVDFAQAFEPQKGTVRGCEILQCSRKLYRKLLDWDPDKVTALLSPFLNKEELRALDARRGSVVWMIRRQIETQGERAVLF